MVEWRKKKAEKAEAKVEIEKKRGKELGLEAIEEEGIIF
jgi:hypothetical protein